MRAALDHAFVGANVAGLPRGVGVEPRDVDEAAHPRSARGVDEPGVRGEVVRENEVRGGAHLITARPAAC